MMQIVLMIAALILAMFGAFLLILAGSVVEKSTSHKDMKEAAWFALIAGPLFAIAALCLAFVSGGL